MISSWPFASKAIIVIVIVFEVCADVSQHLIIYNAQKMPRERQQTPAVLFPWMVLGALTSAERRSRAEFN